MLRTTIKLTKNTKITLRNTSQRPHLHIENKQTQTSIVSILHNYSSKQNSFHNTRIVTEIPKHDAHILRAQ
jgi:hypothetical protein